MPKVKVNGINMNYEQTGSGEPMVLIPFLTADNGCYAFQLPEYSKHFTCFSIDPRGAGETDKPAGPYSTEMMADDVAGFMQALGINKAHVVGTSLGAATALQFAAKYPDKVKSLSAHSAWTKTDLFILILVNGWKEIAKSKGNVVETAINYIFPWCLTPGIFAAKPNYIMGLVDFVKSRPAQPVDGFLAQCDAVLSHDCRSQLGSIKAPTLLTFGKEDMISSVPTTRFIDDMKSNIRNPELVVFDGCAHTPMYEKTEEYNQKTLEFLKRHAG